MIYQPKTNPVPLLTCDLALGATAGTQSQQSGSPPVPRSIFFPHLRKNRATLAHIAAGDGYNIAKPQPSLSGSLAKLFHPTPLGVPGNGGLETPLSLCFPPHPSMLWLPLQTACPLLPAPFRPTQIAASDSRRRETSNTSKHTSVEFDGFNGN